MNNQECNECGILIPPGHEWEADGTVCGVCWPVRFERRYSCHADRDGECQWSECPQLRDNEPHKTGRHCPYDNYIDPI